MWGRPNKPMLAPKLHGTKKHCRRGTGAEGDLACALDVAMTVLAEGPVDRTFDGRLLVPPNWCKLEKAESGKLRWLRYSLASSRNLTSWLLGPLDTWGGGASGPTVPFPASPGLASIYWASAAFVKKGAALILSKLASIPARARARAPGPCQ